MNSSYATEEMRQAYRFYVSAAGSEAQAGEILGQAAFDVDDFKDTRLGGWWVGYEHAPLWGAASGIVNYTSYWHFLNLARDGDSHGNPTAATTTATTRSTAASPTSTGTPWSISTTAS